MGTELLNGSQLNFSKSKPEKGWLKRLAALASGVFFIWVFAIYFTPWLATVPYFHPVLSYIEENDIEATAYFYTDVEEFSVGNHMMQQLLTYPSQKEAKESQPFQ